MTKSTRYQPSDAFKRGLRQRTGFCVEDPDRRIPIQNDMPARILAMRTPRQNDRANQLLVARQGLDGKDRARAFPLSVPGFGLGASWPEDAHAKLPELNLRDLASTLDPQTLMASNWTATVWEIADAILQVDLSHPLFGLTLGGLLLMAQAKGIRQRKQILKTISSADEPAQADLFPDDPSSNGKAEPGTDISLRWSTDAASLQGKVRKENQDAYRVLTLSKNTQVLIVCDGAGGIEGGKEAAQSAVASIEDHLAAIWENTAALSIADLEQAIEQARIAARKKTLTGVTTALVVLLQQDQMSFATLGDGALTVIWPDGMVGPVQVPHHTAGQPSNIINAYIGGDCSAPPRTGSLRLEPGATVLAMTDGASDLFPFEDFALNRECYTQMDGLALGLLTQLEQARDPDTGAWLHSDNMTLAMARLSTGPREEAASCSTGQASPKDGGGHDQTH